MDKQLFSTEFKNGYCVTVFSQSRFELKYYVEVSMLMSHKTLTELSFIQHARFLDIYQIFKTISKKTSQMTSLQERREEEYPYN